MLTKFLIGFVILFGFDDDVDGRSSLVGSAISEVIWPPGVILTASPDFVGSIAPPTPSPVVSAPRYLSSL